MAVKFNFPNQTTAINNTDITGTISDSTGPVTIGDTLEVSGATTFASTVAISGATTVVSLTDSAKTIDTTAGDAATCNSMTGRFRKDTSGTTFTLTNSLIAANSIIHLTPASDPGAAIYWWVTAGVGSAVITFSAAPANNTYFNFLVTN